MKSKKWLALLLSAAFVLPFGIAGCTNGNDDEGDNGGNGGLTEGEGDNGGNTGTPGEDTSTKLTGKIYLVGDSTVCSFSDNYYLPRYGYGTQLYKYLNCDSNQIVNLALSGRSSKSFLTESNYNTLKNSISAGDYLIIGFGHNDEKSDEPARFTDPNGTYTEATTAKGDSFQYVLYENYVKLAKDKGATPILCTPITRYDDKGAYTGSKVHVTSDGDYVQAIKNLGAATNTTVIDLTTITKDIYKADNDAAQYFHAHTSYKEATHKPTTGEETPDGRDDTHINMYGAKMVSYQLTQALFETDCPLKANVKTNTFAPSKEVDYSAAINMDYVKPAYDAFDPSNTTATKLTTTTQGDTSADWYKTVMGDIGGNNVDKFTVSESDGTFTVGNTDGKGKFASGSDGFAAAFIQVDASKNFTASATVKVKSIASTATNQSGFGLMLRDDILIDTNQAALSTNYVAAGILNTKAPIFSREDGKLTSGGSSGAIKAGDTYDVSIVRVGQTVTVKVGSNTKTYTDFDFFAVDNDHMYLCLFANRGIVAEFSNVRFEITGESQGA